MMSKASIDRVKLRNRDVIRSETSAVHAAENEIGNSHAPAF